jgi:thioredoxin 1
MLLEQNHNFSEEIKGSIVVVDFFATWCGPCKMLSPILEKFANEHPEVKVIKVDVDDFTSIAREYGVTSIPTLVLFKDGVIVDKKIGFMDYNNLVKWIIK